MADDLIYDEVSYSFNREIMAICVAVRGMSVREVNDLAVAVQRIIAGRS